jgi:high-affinity Fe2+/Pb2+ permease
MGNGNDYFSVTAMFVMFRECMEAAVILAVLLQYVSKTGKTHLKKQGKENIQDSVCSHKSQAGPTSHN